MRRSSRSCVSAGAARHWKISPSFETPITGRATRKVLPFSLGSIHPSRSGIDEWVDLWSKTVVDYLNHVPGSAGDWELLERYPTKMYSSGQQHEVWIISRNRVVCAAGGGGGSSSGATGSGSAAAAAGESACAVVDQDPGSAPAEPSVTPASAQSRKLAGPPPRPSPSTLNPALCGLWMESFNRPICLPQSLA